MKTQAARVAIFSDARVGTDSSGRVAASDPALSGERWRRGLDGLHQSRLIVRVDPRPGTGTHPLTGEVAALPYYKGLASFVRVLPQLVSATRSAVGASEVVVTRLPGLVGMLGSLAALIMKRPLATELVGDPAESLSADGSLSGRVLGIVGGRLTWMIVRRAKVVRYVTQRVLQEQYPPGHGAIALGASDVNLQSWLDAPAGAESEVATVIAVGSQEQLYKGHAELISAVGLMRRDGLDVRLILVGAGQHQAFLREHARGLGLTEYVEFTGYIDDPAVLRRLVDSAWVYAMPSHTEGLPRSLVEAMARSRACVGSDVGGIRELLPDRYRVPPKDSIALARVLGSFIGEASARRTAGQANRQRAQQLHDSSRHATAEWSNSVALLSEVDVRA